MISGQRGRLAAILFAGITIAVLPAALSEPPPASTEGGKPAAPR